MSPATALGTITHVLAWSPPYLVDADDYDGQWDLFTLAAYDAAKPAPPRGMSLAVARDADPAYLTQWVQDRLGYPVFLVRDEVPIGFDGVFRNEPVHLVHRVGS
jgi:hypothetical protein